MLVGRGATAKQSQHRRAGVPELVPLPGRDGDGVAFAHVAGLAVDADASGAMGDEIDFLGAGMVMFPGGAADGEAGFGEALVADGGVAMGEQFADFGTVPGDERRLGVEVFDIHKGADTIAESGAGLNENPSVGSIDPEIHAAPRPRSSSGPSGVGMFLHIAKDIFHDRAHAIGAGVNLTDEPF